jgi:hypothetical protein
VPVGLSTMQSKHEHKWRCGWAKNILKVKRYSRIRRVMGVYDKIAVREIERVQCATGIKCHGSGTEKTKEYSEICGRLWQKVVGGTNASSSTDRDGRADERGATGMYVPTLDEI